MAIVFAVDDSSLIIIPGPCFAIPFDHRVFRSGRSMPACFGGDRSIERPFEVSDERHFYASELRCAPSSWASPALGLMLKNKLHLCCTSCLRFALGSVCPRERLRAVEIPCGARVAILGV